MPDFPDRPRSLRPRLATRVKHWLFRSYGWIALAAFVGLVAFNLIAGVEVGVTVAGAAATLTFVHFVQQQKLAETRLFRELFTEFNQRYDEMNERVNALAGRSREELKPDELALLYDYFNLCGEEYLFYELGYIVPDAWESWERGMLEHIACSPAIAAVWAEERKSESYYGLESVLGRGRQEVLNSRGDRGLLPSDPPSSDGEV